MMCLGWVLVAVFWAGVMALSWVLGWEAEG